MKRLTFLLFFLIGLNPVFPLQSDSRDACISCHITVDEDLDDGDKIMPHFYDDVHYEKGLSCADCHGGDPTAFDDEDAAMTDSDSFLGEVTRDMEPEVCGKCHSDPSYMRQYTAHVKTDQVEQYWTSMHGMRLKEGNDKVAVCTDCHGLHGIRAVSDTRSQVSDFNVPGTCSRCHSDAEYMAEFKIPTDQFAKYKTSVHGKALLERRDSAAPACNDCHGNHGAQPPNIAHISDICGTCHVNNMNLFQNSHIAEIFSKRQLGQCAGCHNYHDIAKPTDEFISWSDKSICRRCHKDNENAKELATGLYNIINNLKMQNSVAIDKVENAEQRGMEVSDLQYELEDVHQTLIQTRTAIHSFNTEYVQKVADKGFKAAEAAITGADNAITELLFRRKGLFVASLIISFLVIVVYLQIRSYEDKD